jgi:hypothetical protein
MKNKMRSRSPRRFLALAFVAALGLAFGPGAHAKDVCEVNPEDLTPGIPVTGIAGSNSCASGPIFFVDVPAGATRLTFSTMGGSGEADLLVKRGSPPTSLADSERHSTEPGNAESVRIDNPAAGTWYVQVFPRPGFSGVALTADLVAPEIEVEDRVPKDGLSDDLTGGIQYFTVTVPPGTANLAITTTGGTGNADLLVRRAALPTTAIFDFASRGRTNTERIDIPSPQGGIFKIALVANAPFNGLTLLVTLTPANPVGTCVPTPLSLCLLGGRFQVDVTWTDQHSGGVQGVGTALPGTDQTGYFWFFSAANTELVVKMVDGRTLNNHFWVFRGGLSDVDYTIRVTDTATGAVRTYRNLPNTLTSGADTSAF